MKFKFKAVATAVALALSSVASFAAINVSSNPDLLFVAYDHNGSGATYVRDLGSLSQLSSNQSWTAPVGSIFGTQFASVAPANIYWNVIAVDSTVNKEVVYTTGSFAQQSGAGYLNSDIGGGASTIIGSSFSALDNAANGYAKPNGEYSGAAAATDYSNGYTIANLASFQNTTSGHGVGSSQNFIKSAADGTGDGFASAIVSQLYLNSALSAFDGNSKGGYFTLLDAAGDISWTASAVTATPLPAAAALFLPGLLGMFGVARRRNKAA